jgi:hypothetical protein
MDPGISCSGVLVFETIVTIKYFEITSLTIRYVASPQKISDNTRILRSMIKDHCLLCILKREALKYFSPYYADVIPAI